MNKHLFNSKDDFDKWLDTQVEGIGDMFHGFGCIEEVERFYGVTFLAVNGKSWEEFELNDDFADFADYADVTEEGLNEEGWKMARPVQYKVREDAFEEPRLPEKYPCVAVSWLESTFDRLGDMSILALEYVYPSDFEQ